MLARALLVFVVLGASAWANSQLVSDLLQTSIAAWAAVSAFLAAGRSSGYLRRLWRLFTVSLILVVCAQVIESYYENPAHTPFAKPWLSDIVFLLWVIPALIMLLPRPVEELAGIAWETIAGASLRGPWGNHRESDRIRRSRHFSVLRKAANFISGVVNRSLPRNSAAVHAGGRLVGRAAHEGASQFRHRMPTAPLLPCEENLTACVPLKLDRELSGSSSFSDCCPPKMAWNGWTLSS